MPADGGPGGLDDVKMREARLEALVQVLGFVDLDDLENFVYLHGSVKVVPAAQRDTLPLDETQTQASEDHRARRRLDRLKENAQLKADLERTKVDLAWHKLELQRERALGEALVEDKVRLLENLGSRTPSRRGDAAVGLGERTDASLESSPPLDQGVPTEASYGHFSDKSKDVVGSKSLRRRAALSEGLAPVADSEGYLSLGGLRPSTASEEATKTPTLLQPGAAAVKDAESIGAVRVCQSPAICEHATSPRLPSLLAFAAPTTISDCPAASANLSDRHRPLAFGTPRIASGACGTTALDPIRAPTSGLSEPVASLSSSPAASALRKISLYPKLLSTHRQFREAVRRAQARLSHLEERLRLATDTIRSAVMASFGPAPARLDLEAYPDALELPLEAGQRAAFVQSVDFDAAYHTLYRQEQELSRQDALVRRWIASVENLLSEVSTATPAPVAMTARSRPSPAPSAAVAIRKKRRVTSQPVVSPPTGRSSTACGPDVVRDPSAAPSPRIAWAITVPYCSDQHSTPPADRALQDADTGKATHDEYGSRLSHPLAAAMDTASPPFATKRPTQIRESAYSTADLDLDLDGRTAPSDVACKAPGRRTQLDENGSPSASSAHDLSNGPVRGPSVHVTPPRGTLPRSSHRSQPGEAGGRVASRGQHVRLGHRYSAGGSTPLQAPLVDSKLGTAPAARREARRDLLMGGKSITSITHSPPKIKDEASQVVDMVDSSQRACDSPAGHAQCPDNNDASPSASPTAAWSDLDALTPPAIDEETRKKLKKRNQLKRKRRRNGSDTAGSVVNPDTLSGGEPVTRRKADRQRLLAEACESCTAYYQRAGKPVKCMHIAARNPDSASHYLAIRARNMEERLQEGGRHRVHQPTEATPLDYWQFGFPSTQEVDEFNARARARKSR